MIIHKNILIVFNYFSGEFIFLKIFTIKYILFQNEIAFK